MNRDQLLSLLPSDGSFVNRQRLLSRVAGLTGHPVPPRELENVIRAAKQRGLVQEREHGWALSMPRRRF